jgi:citrate lyase subunit beta/citryl-CoA lyase
MAHSEAPSPPGWKLPPCRSYLYVSGTKPELFPKALASEADALILDLEDGVPIQSKARARDAVASLLETPPAKPVFVRTNQLDSAFAEEDLEVAARLPVTGIRVPMVHRARELGEACQRLRDLGFTGGLQVQIESAEGLVNLREIAQSDPFVEILSLGEGDLCSELACDREALRPARLEIVIVSRAVGLQRPIQAGHPDLSGSEPPGLTSREGREAGFFGRIAVHPNQVPAINRAYTPCAHEVDYARDTLERLQVAIESGQTTTRDTRGKYVSEWYRPRGERVLRDAEVFGALDGCPTCNPGAPGL